MRVRHLLSVVSLALCAAAAPAATGTPVKIVNPGFEETRKGPVLSSLPEDVRRFYDGCSDSPFAGWVFGGKWDGGEYTVHVSSEAHGGKRAVEIRCVKQGRGGIACSPFKLMPGTILRVGFWVKARGAEGGNVFLNFEGSAGDGWNRLDIPGGTYDWKYMYRRCVVPSRRTGPDGQTIVLFFYSKAKGSVWIDDVEVEVVDVNAMAEAPDTPALQAPRPREIPRPAGSRGYRVYVADSLAKVFPDTDFLPAGKLPRQAAIALAKDEREAFQVVIEAPWREVAVRGLEFSDFVSDTGAKLPASRFRWWREDFVETTIRPNYPVERVGWYPDPLMPAAPFRVKRLSRVPLWVSLHAPRDAAAGVYRGRVTVVPEGLAPTVVPVTVEIFDFALPERFHLRTLTWCGMGGVLTFYGAAGVFSGLDAAGKRAKRGEITERFQEILLAHHLGPGGQVADRVYKNRKTGKYNFKGVDATLERLLAKGMNAFIMGTAPNLKRQGKKSYSPQFIASFTDMVKAYGDHLREKGWLDYAYVYTFDEAPKPYWSEVRKIAQAIHRAAPGLRVLQCLNQPRGVKALGDAIDVFDVYVAQYHRSGVAELQKKRGTKVWLAICCYPASHPNFFIEYPLIDVRITPLFCWKYRAEGFEYWSPVSWGENWRRKPPNQWPQAPWNPNTFGRYNGDGYLLYPGPGGVPYPSIRLKALRDGFEDYEYLWLLRDLVRRCEAAGVKPPALARARGLLDAGALIDERGAFNNDAKAYFAFRAAVARAVAELRKVAPRAVGEGRRP